MFNFTVFTKMIPLEFLAEVFSPVVALNYNLANCMFYSWCWILALSYEFADFSF